MTRLIEEIIVPETWFFRDEFAFEALIAQLNKKITINNNLPVRVLSLPSSTGEEAYSIAIKLFENGYKSDMFSIDAFDISQRNIDSAQRGNYRQHSFRNKLPERIMKKYFTVDKENDVHIINDEVKNMVHFEQKNLFHSDTLNIPSYYDAVFCRNLLIYFNSNEKKKAIDKIHATLKDKGILLIGHSETSIIPTQHYAQCGIPRSFGFIKSTRPIKRKKITASRKTIAAKKPVQAKKNTPPPVAIVNTPQPKKQQAAVSKEKVANEPSLTEARKLADRSQFKEALAMLNSFSSSQHSADYFTLTGTINSALKDFDQAETAYRKALFLSPQHQEALIHLAFLLEKKGEHKKSQLLRKRVEKSRIKTDLANDHER